MNVYSLPYDVFVCMHSPCLCVRELHVFILQIVFDCNCVMKGVMSYFPSPGVIHYVVSMCIPSEQEFGGSVEIRRPNMDIPNDKEGKRPNVA